MNTAILAIAALITIILGYNYLQNAFDSNNVGSKWAHRKYKNDVRPTTDKAKIPHFDLLIIGAGAQGWKLIAEFSKLEYEHEDKFRVGIVETKSKLGPGLPYDDDVVIHQHLLNPFEAVDNRPHLKNYLPKPEFEIEETADAYDRVVLTPPAARYVQGKYLLDEFDKSVKECEKKGYKIQLMRLTTAVNIERLHFGGFAVTLSGGHNGTVTTIDIFLATGHWYPSRFNTKVNGYFESPWPASRLKKTVEALHVAIFGSGLSAVDAALTLAYKFGKFEYKDKRFHYKIKKENEKGHFKITMYSRSGYLPPVAGTPANDSDFRKNGTAELAKRIQENGIGSKKFLPLDDVFELLKEDLAAFIPDIAKTTDRFDEMGPGELIEHINFYAYQNKDYKQKLIDDIAAARESVNEGTLLLVQDFFYYLGNFFHIFLEHFSAEDTKTFKKHIAPAISKWFCPIPPHNAEKMFALMDASRLFLEAVGDHSDVVPDTKTNKGVYIRYNGKEIYHRYFVDAKGQSGDISKDPTPLTQNLLKNQLIQPLYIPYADTEKGKLDLKEYKRTNPTGDLIKLGDDKFIYHKTDGTVVNWKTMHAIPPGQTEEEVIRNANKGVIYAFGPFTYRRYALLQAIPIAGDLAANAIADIRQRRFKKKARRSG